MTTSDQVLGPAPAGNLELLCIYQIFGSFFSQWIEALHVACIFSTGKDWVEYDIPFLY